MGENYLEAGDEFLVVTPEELKTSIEAAIKASLEKVAQFFDRDTHHEWRGAEIAGVIRRMK